MKKLSEYLGHPKDYQKILLGMLCIILIWAAGSYVSIAGHTPFAHLSVRIIFSVLIAFYFFSKLYPHIVYNHKNHETSPTLKKRFISAMDFLKKTSVNSLKGKKQLDDLPWFFLLGLPGSGKTTFLANSGIHYILAKKFKTITPSKECDWWITKKSVFLDIPGTLLTPESQDNWLQLLMHLKKYTDADLTKGIVVLLNAEDLNDSESLDAKLNLLKHGITSLQKIFSSYIPVYITLNHCDKIPGFLPFLSHLPSKKREQPLGFKLDENNIKTSFNEKYPALIERIQQQLIAHVKKENDIAQALSMKDFPLELLKRKNILSQVLTTLTDDSSYSVHIKGFYLCSATQGDKALTRASDKTIQSSYFIHDLLAGILPKKPESSKPFRPCWINRTLNIIMLVAVASTALLWTGQFYRHLSTVKKTKSALHYYYTQFDEPKNSKLQHILIKLQKLNEAKKALSKDRLSLPIRLEVFHNGRLNANLNLALRSVVDLEFEPLLTQILEKNLKVQITQKDDANLYDTLKTYLMLEEPKHLDAQYFARVISALTKKPSEEKTLLILLGNLDTQKVHINTKKSLVNPARKRLNQLGPVKIAIAILKNHHPGTEKPLFHFQQNAWLSMNKRFNQIDRIFTRPAFKSVVSQDIPSFNAMSLQEAWVLGEGQHKTITQTHFTKQLLERYLTDYSHAWVSLVDHLHTTSPTSLELAKTLLGQLIGEHSSLLHVLTRIQENTNLTEINIVNLQLAKLNTLLTPSIQPGKTLRRTFMSMAELQGQLMKITQSVNADKSTFDFAGSVLNVKEHAKSSKPLIKTDGLPTPLKPWLDKLSSDIWHLLVKKSISYLKAQQQDNPLS